MKPYYDVIVIGAGHAGCEAAFAAARAGAEVLLVTQNLDHIAQMSCNPAVGGIAKGQLVREIDAMGGAQGMVTDASAIQFRMLNRGKGPAVRSPRSQCDKAIYQRGMKYLLEQTKRIDILQSEVVGITVEADRRLGVLTQFDEKYIASALVVSSGTFLNGKLHFGMKNFPGGRAGDANSSLLSNSLRDIGLRLGRLKTGTPPRILAKTIDFSQMGRQEAENEPEEFSFWREELRPSLPRASRRQMPCYTVYSTKETADIVRENLMLAPLYQGVIEGIGARYCPSFEDKVVRFAHHEKHLLYLEPEGADTGEYYINGISTSLPPHIQKRMIASIPGMEHAVISRYAYAIEYDFLFPDQIDRSLMVKSVPGLFTAGQINGTSGYEEAAGQGLIAGLNAARFAAGKPPVEMSRDSSYIGVMIDDLVTKEIVEPYRLFTSRAEYRLHLRQDNANLRLCDFARDCGILPDDKYEDFLSYRKTLDRMREEAQTTRVKGGRTLFESYKDYGGTPPEPPSGPDMPYEEKQTYLALRQIVIEAHYDGYLQREARVIDRMSHLENWKIPPDFDYSELRTLSNESRQKLEKVRPTTLAQASRIDGVTPAEIALLQIYLKRRGEAR